LANTIADLIIGGPLATEVDARPDEPDEAGFEPATSGL